MTTREQGVSRTQIPAYVLQGISYKDDLTTYIALCWETHHMARFTFIWVHLTGYYFFTVPL
jgi:hypothetical protein